MRLDPRKVVPFLLVGALAVAFAFVAPAGFAKEAVTDPAALEGGNPVPDGAMKATFGWFGKQSITFTSDAEIERMVGLVSFDNATAAPLGTAESDGKGGGSFSFKVPISAMKTGSKDRDEHLAGPMWLDAAKFPEITFTSTKFERVKPTVWKVTGTWSMHGVQKEVSFLANVRHVGKIDRVGDSVIRVRAEFPISLKAFGVQNQYVGSPAVAESWDVSVDVLGVIGK
jgi:polyisoprenoid-binding protein YceI